jgi:regulator of cell morphogenesis and NO signaling
MSIDIETKTIGELALEYPNAIAVMERWQIDYCCRGHEPISVACRRAGVTPAELFDAIAGPVLAEETDWRNAPLTGLVRYIVDTHHRHERQAMETIFLLSDKVRARHGENHPEVLDVHRLVLDLFAELEPHMMKEEQVLFPYIEALDRGDSSESCFGTAANPVRVMMMEHDSAGEKLAELRKVTDNYALPGDVCLSFRALYERLADFEQDLRHHIHLENNVLFPRALAMES